MQKLPALWQSFGIFYARAFLNEDLEKTMIFPDSMVNGLLIRGFAHADIYSKWVIVLQH